MKSLLVTAAIIAGAYSAGAQATGLRFTPFVTAGTAGGQGGFTGFSPNDGKGSGFYMAAGATMGYFVTKHFGIGAGAAYNAGTITFNHLGSPTGFIRVKDQLGYVTIPIFVTLRTAPEKPGLYLNGGVKLATITTNNITEYATADNSYIGKPAITTGDKKIGIMPFGEAGIALPLTRRMALHIGMGFHYRIHASYNDVLTQKIYAGYGQLGLAIRL